MAEYRRGRGHDIPYDGYEYNFRERTAGRGPYDAADCKPITSRVGTGRRARIAVETGGPYVTAFDDARKLHLERRKMALEQAKAEAKRKNENRHPRPPRRPRPPSEEYSSPSPHSSPSPQRRHSSHGTGPVPVGDDIILEPLPPERPEARIDYGASFSPIVISGADDEEDCDFQLPVRPQAVTYDYVEDVSFPLDADSNEDTKRSQTSKPKFTGPFTELSISKSSWLGSAYDRGDLSAEISVLSSGDSSKEKAQERLMKWYHLERSPMSFEEFIAASQSLLEVSEQKRRDVNKLLRDVQRKFEQQRQHGRDLEPNCMSDLYVGDSSSTQSACVMFLSFPYFCLEQYNATQFKNLTSGTPIHPLRPLLQAHFHSTSQRRELAQTITKFPNTGENSCLHLSQVWSLIVDGDTMITCSRQSHDALCDRIITKSDVSKTDKTAKIRVSLGNDRSWLIPVTDETTWPAFLSVFGESIASLETDGAVADFKVNGESVNAKQWSFLLQVAKSGGSVGLDLEQAMLQPAGPAQIVQTMPDTGPPETPVVVVESGSEPTGQASRAEGMTFAAPTQVNVDATAIQVDDKDSLSIFKYTSDPTIQFLADDLDSVLRTNNREQEQLAYTEGTAIKAFALHTQAHLNSTSPADYGSGILGPALYLFRFFLPLSFDHSISDKYWGAVKKVIGFDSRTSAAAGVESVMQDLTDNVIPVMESLIREFATFEKDLEPLPDAYSKAFLHLIMIFLLVARINERPDVVSHSTIRAHLKGLREELGAGKREVTSRLNAQAPHLEDLEICSSGSLLTLVINKLSQDIMHGRPDVANTYNDYFYQLDFQITEDPTPRSHQETLRFFLQEVEAILATLQYQQNVLETFEQSIRQQQQESSSSGNDSFLLQYALGESRQSLVLDDAKARVAARIDKFRGLQQRAQDLGEWHRNEMETNKDRQENAIMVFTIVTIIFLPLSFVSSVFGMNTVDVRDMPYGQWAYWAAGIPLTVVVVVGSLWWAGEFEGFGSWVQKVTTRATSASGGYSRIPEPVSYGNRGRRGDEVDVRWVNPPSREERYYGGGEPATRRRPVYPRRRY